MPADLWTDATRMIGAGLAVAAVAAPLGLLGWGLARRAGTPLLPCPRPWRVPWTGFEVIVAFLVVAAVVPGLVFAAASQSAFFQQVYGPDFASPGAAPAPPFEAVAAVAGTPAATVAQAQAAERAVVVRLWTGLLALPVQLGLLAAAVGFLYPQRRPTPGSAVVPARVALAVLAWAGLTPSVLLIHAGVNLIFLRLGWEIEDHPLTTLSAARPAIDHILLVLNAAVAAPLVEELLFRGVLLGWLVGGRALIALPPGVRPRPAADRRVWPVLVIGVAVAVVTVPEPGEWFAGPTRGPVLFAAALVAGWAGLRLVLRKRRTAGAVYASAALFAVVHSTVWPSPVPLFALGLGLGWLAVRTRGVLVPVVVHGLFNAVSVLFVLRGPG